MYYNKSTIHRNKKEKIIMRVLSFQSQEVLDILNSDGEFIRDINKSREGRENKLELEEYGYDNVIWVFAPMDMSRLGDRKYFIEDDFVSGDLFHSFSCELSVRRTTDLNDLLLLEIDVDEEHIKTGLTHNSCSYVKVINGLKKEQIKAVYKLNYDRSREVGWYYPIVEVIERFNDNTIFKESFKCHEVEETVISNSFGFIK